MGCGTSRKAARRDAAAAPRCRRAARPRPQAQAAGRRGGTRPCDPPAPCPPRPAPRRSQSAAASRSSGARHR
ncbi:MAG: hypothetical protein EOP68_08300 [Sphingomonas sp.]|nr:MAG: hypothetical protein EOP68_08300 [Sphingomonas sp.]